MKGSSFKYLCKEGCKNLWFNRVMAVTSIAILTTCLILVGAAYLITINVNKIVGYVQSESEIVVFLKEVDEAKRKEIQANFEKNPEISSVEYTSKEQGLEDAKELIGDSGYLLDGYKDRNPIPESFVIKIKDIAKTADLAEEFRAIEGVDVVKAAVDVADTLVSLKKMINTFGMVIVGVLVIVSVVIISNTIRATIFTRRKEINIMKYVGATNSFIRIPFVVEGFLLGLVSAVLAFLLIWGGYTWIVSAVATDSSLWLNSALANIIPFKQIASQIALFFAGAGVVVSTIGSIISIKSHVKV
ncbi:MAG: permease-like cell division protein FtsX [Oscillospiraceae bacterium]